MTQGATNNAAGITTAGPGPTPAEARMFDVWDVFERLLDRHPQRAAQLAYELAEVAERYTKPSGARPPDAGS